MKFQLQEEGEEDILSLLLENICALLPETPKIEPIDFDILDETELPEFHL